MNDLVTTSSRLVQNKYGRLITTSLIVAESFGKQHSHVLRDIDNIITSSAYQARVTEGNASNFGLVDYLDAKGERRRMYEMDRQGFEILAMGFTGENALRWKFAYSDAFAAMEAELRTPTAALTAELRSVRAELQALRATLTPTARPDGPSADATALDARPIRAYSNPAPAKNGGRDSNPGSKAHQRPSCDTRRYFCA